MSADKAGKAVGTCQTAWCYTKLVTVNTWRRAAILGRYGLACWQLQRLNRALARLGDQTLQALEKGEANPMVSAEVNEALQRAKELKGLKEKNYQAIEEIRDKIRRYQPTEAPPPPEEPPGGELP